MEKRFSDSTLRKLSSGLVSSALIWALPTLTSCSSVQNEAAAEGPTGRRLAATQESSADAILFASMSPQNTGDPVDARSYSWQVGLSISYAGETWRCGGILISPSYVLTAAHCLDGAPPESMDSITRIGIDTIEVFHGSNQFGGGTPLALDRTWPVTFHPRWKTASVAYAWDAALLRLAQPLDTAIAAPVRSIPFGTAWAVTSGWGNYDATDRPSDVLRAVQVPVVDNRTCRERLAAVDARSEGSSHLANALHSTTLCAISRMDDACVSDSGGPLVAGMAARPQTIGIVSWGLSGSCGVPGPTGELIGAYTRASELVPWILQATGESRAVTNAALDPLFEVRPANDR